MSSMRLSKFVKTSYQIYIVNHFKCNSVSLHLAKPTTACRHFSNSSQPLQVKSLYSSSMLYPNFETKFLRFCSTDSKTAENIVTENLEETPIEIIKDEETPGGNVNKGDDFQRGIMKRGSDQPQTVSYEVSVQYLMSDAYKETYGDDPVWVSYRRNHKGGKPRIKTREMCFRSSKLASGNPCPICRDEYLVIDYRNIKLLEQFLSTYTGQIISFTKTGICQMRYKQIQVAVRKAKDYGLIVYDVPFRKYDYADYYHELKN